MFWTHIPTPETFIFQMDEKLSWLHTHQQPKKNHASHISFFKVDFTNTYTSDNWHIAILSCFCSLSLFRSLSLSLFFLFLSVYIYTYISLFLLLNRAYLSLVFQMIWVLFIVLSQSCNRTFHSYLAQYVRTVYVIFSSLKICGKWDQDKSCSMRHVFPIFVVSFRFWLCYFNLKIMEQHCTILLNVNLGLFNYNIGISILNSIRKNYLDGPFLQY